MPTRKGSGRSLMRQLSDGLGLAEFSNKLLGEEPPPVDFTGRWECVAVDGESGKLLEALKVPFLKRKMTNVGNIGELVEIKHEGRRGLTVSEVWSPRDGANNQRKLTFTLDGREQSIPAPNGEFAQANIEWEDDVM